MTQTAQGVFLPKPTVSGEDSLELLLSRRRSVREYREGAIELSEIGQLLWAAQGVSHPQGYRTAPSAGALYPLELYLVVGDVQGLDSGVYRYVSQDHSLVKTADGDRRKDLAQAAMFQSWVQDAAAVVVFTVVYGRTTHK